MEQLVFNEFEKVVSDDLNNQQLAANKTVNDDFIYEFFSRPSGGVVGSGLIVGFVNATHFSLGKGIGYFFDNTQTGYNAKFRQIKVAADIASTAIAAASGSDRIDVVCLAPNFAVTSTASRFVKTGGSGPVVLSTVDKIKDSTYTIQIVQGTPGVTPSAPATPAGYIALAQLYVTATTGMAGAGAVTDVRSVFSISVSNSGHLILTGGNYQTQLDQADAALSSVLPVNISSSTLIVAATHRGRYWVLDMRSFVGGQSMNISLPVLVAGFEAELADVYGTLNESVTAFLLPNGTDKVNGLNTSLPLQATYGSWKLVGTVNGWLVR